jgi:YegS/Rv2252/BmrU family lipid kinase
MAADLPLIILNPKSGRGLSEQQWASKASIIRNSLGPFECRFTTKPNDATRMAQEEAAAGRKLIVAMGGDGTISEVANGILQSGTAAVLGVLPGGTGGDFRRTLDVPGNLAEAARKLRSGKTRLMDAGRLSFVLPDGSRANRYFVNTASFGMSGRVAGHANRSAKTFGGTVTYAAATVRTLFSYDYPDVHLQWDDQPPCSIKIITVCVANGPSFGGGMRIAPHAKLNDGIFDMVIIGDLTAAQVLLNSYRLYTGSFLGIKNVALVNVKKVTAAPVNQNEEVLLEVDGETPGRLPATIEILPGALRIRC